ncbi:FtsQ-type POTRA domain-containing protein [Arthrobacter sp. fls2-241-R2A-200]|uniref:FtsQ-type POTRA domain-containing protein n=1 Tax=Arthrobacter sp. fls2-241-R2A-200 TaxID=3040281 RepID=UPI00254E47DC|nr:FtsQ-type POTRA domain-containing protein [Arthrobacter sp. fls2-241-R2A-200]
MASTRKPGPIRGGADVISAQRSVEVPRPAEPGGKQAKAEAPANVIVFPEPKGKRKRRLIGWTLAIIVVLVAAIVAGAVYSPVLAVRSIAVDGTKLVTPDAVQKALSGLQGKPLPQVSEQQVNDLLKPLVQVRSATVEARPPSELLVHIDERVPVALLKQGDAYVMVDVDGVQLGVTKDPAGAALPLIDPGAGTVNTDLFKAIAAVLDTLPADVLAKMATASATSPDAVELKLVDGKTVVWGNAEDRELKAKALQALLNMPPNPKDPINVYDVSVPRHPFTK